MSQFEDNPDFSHLYQSFTVRDKEHTYIDLPAINPEKYERLPYCIRVWLESAIRCCDENHVTYDDVMAVVDWERNQNNGVEVPFMPARVTLHDFTGIPPFVDFAAVRDTVVRLGGDPNKVVSQCPVDIVIDHFVPIEPAKSAPPTTPSNGGVKGGSQCGVCVTAPSQSTETVCPFHDLPTDSASLIQKNDQLEFERNKERYALLKWGAQALGSVTVVPPGSGQPNQAVLQYLARIVSRTEDGLLYPDSVLGTDSHTTLVNGLGVVGWGVGGIEVEDVMLGHPVMMTLPRVVGCKLVGKPGDFVTSTDLVLAITKLLRQSSLGSDTWVEFYGEGVQHVSAADRQAIAGMCPDYGARCAYFPIDNYTLDCVRHMGHAEEGVEIVYKYLTTVGLFGPITTDVPAYSHIIELDLTTIQSCCSGPKRAQDKVVCSQMKEDFLSCLSSPVSTKGFGVTTDKMSDTVSVTVEEDECQLTHGAVVLAAIASCTNATNASVMLAAGLLAKNACEAGLSVKPHVKTSLMPGSGLVTHYLKYGHVIHHLERLGFDVVGYGCMTCVSNSTPVQKAISTAVEKGNVVTVSMLSGNRNTEGRVQLATQANYLASPLLVIAYALAGTVTIDLDKEPIGVNHDGKSVFLRDIWPSAEDIQEAENTLVIPSLFKELSTMITANERWCKLESPEGAMYPWTARSTFIRAPPFLDNLSKEPRPLDPIREAYTLLYLGDNVSTDHISPAGSIARNSPAARYLSDIGLSPRDFNSYGARRGNYAVMMRGTFGNARILNKLVGKPGPKTVHIPSGKVMDVYDAAERYKLEGHPVILLAGKDYGAGSSRDWVAKGPWLLGVKAVLAQSFDRAHRSNLIGMGILPLQFLEGDSAESLRLTGREVFTVDLPDMLTPGHGVVVKTSNGKSFKVVCCAYTHLEVSYLQHGGILNYTVRQAL